MMAFISHRIFCRCQYTAVKKKDKHVDLNNKWSLSKLRLLNYNK